jgi:Holliday junction resolvase RusA-like endonuclease
MTAKLSIVISGTPRINQSIHYTRKGELYKPETALENEKILRAGIISQLPFDFKPLAGPLLITRLHFVFPPSPSAAKEERLKILKGETIEKDTKPDISDCLKSVFKAMFGTVFGSDAQISGMNDVRKCCGINPKIEIEIEEITDKDVQIPV